MSSFKKLGLSKEILKVLEELGFENPTEIQERAIPQLLEGDIDFIGLAQTGTGKTAAFGLPLLDRIDTSRKYTQALVLAPTRELGKQIAEQLETFSKYKSKVNVLAVYGGASISTQIKALRKTVHVIIATPGRLIDLIKRKAVKLEDLQMLILDEADEMLNMGFKEELDEILSYTPDYKLTWLFSATMPSAIKRIVKKYMDEPLEVRVDFSQKVNKNIDHQYTVVKRSNKMEALTRFIDVDPLMRGVVFCRTKRDTQELAEQLLYRNYKADAIHGDLSQNQRDRVMKRFKSNDLQLLIATDVAARGIDVNDLTHVFHYTLPDDQSYYTHRSGRTARAGKKGTSISFINGREDSKIRRIQKDLGISFTKVTVPKQEDIVEIRVEKWCNAIVEAKKIKVDQSILDKAEEIFGDLTKEELIEKILSNELKDVDQSGGGDLNEKKSSRDGGDRGRGRGRSRDRNRRRDRGGQSKKSRGGSKYRGNRRSKESEGDSVKEKRSKRFDKSDKERDEKKSRRYTSSDTEGDEKRSKRFTSSDKGKDYGNFSKKKKKRKKAPKGTKDFKLKSNRKKK